MLVDRFAVKEGDRFKTLAGTRLVLLTDGRLAELRRSGASWDSGERWNVVMQILSAREAIDHHGLPPCTEAWLRAAAQLLPASSPPIVPRKTKL